MPTTTMTTFTAPAAELLDLSPPPAGSTLLGQADGIVYCQLPDGNIWMRSWKTWRLFCTAEQWPHTATSRSIQPLAEASPCT